MTNTIFNTFAGKATLLPIRALQFKIPKTDYSVNSIPKSTNVGDGILTLATPPTGTGIAEGRYKVTFSSAETQGFEVSDSGNNVIGTGTVGTAFTGAVNFTIGEGTVPFIVGDSFTIYAVKGEYLIIYNTESESSYRLIPKTRTNDKGQTITLGYIIEMFIYFPYNKYNENGLIGLLTTDLKSNYELSILLGNAKPGYPGEFVEPQVINYTDNLTITFQSGKLNHILEIESVELRGRSKLTFSGFIKDLTTDNIIFSSSS